MNEAERRDICSRIKQARTEAGLTQPELAALLQVELRTYWNYENSRVPWAHLREIAKATDKTWEWLVHGDERTITRRLEEVETSLEEILGVLAARTQAERTAKAAEALDRLRQRMERERTDTPEAPPGEPGSAAG